MSDDLHVKFDRILRHTVTTNVDGVLTDLKCISELMFEDKTMAIVETPTLADAKNLIERCSNAPDKVCLLIDLKVAEILPTDFMDDRVVISSSMSDFRKRKTYLIETHTTPK